MVWSHWELRVGGKVVLAANILLKMLRFGRLSCWHSRSLCCALNCSESWLTNSVPWPGTARLLVCLIKKDCITYKQALQPTTAEHPPRVRRPGVCALHWKKQSQVKMQMALRWIHFISFPSQSISDDFCLQCRCSFWKFQTFARLLHITGRKVKIPRWQGNNGECCWHTSLEMKGKKILRKKREKKSLLSGRNIFAPIWRVFVCGSPRVAIHSHPCSTCSSLHSFSWFSSIQCHSPHFPSHVLLWVNKSRTNDKPSHWWSGWALQSNTTSRPPTLSLHGKTKKLHKHAGTKSS